MYYIFNIVVLNKMNESSLESLTFSLFHNMFRIFNSLKWVAHSCAEPLNFVFPVSSEWFGHRASVDSWFSRPSPNLSKHSYSGISCPTWFRSCQFFQTLLIYISAWNDFPPEAMGSYLSRAINPPTCVSHIHFTFPITFCYFMGRTTVSQCQTLDVYFRVYFLCVWNRSTRL